MNDARFYAVTGCIISGCIIFMAFVAAFVTAWLYSLVGFPF